MTKTLSADDVRELLRREVEKAGSMRAWGREHGLSGEWVSKVLSGRCIPSDAITKHLGLKRRVQIVRTWTLDNERGYRG
jgi:hypothetical protein